MGCYCGIHTQHSNYRTLRLALSDIHYYLRNRYRINYLHYIFAQVHITFSLKQAFCLTNFSFFFF